jgi:hypothetical protein
MPRWRKMTWAILIWSVLLIAWGVAGAGSLGNNCAGETGDALSTCQAATAVGGGIGLSIIFFLWFVGFIVLAIVWFMTRPKENVVVYGPVGQQMTVSEKEARKRVEKQGWTYTNQPVAGQTSAPPLAPPTDPNAVRWDPNADNPTRSGR